MTPLREGGSLPGLMEADDLGTYVVKFTGAGQGRKALLAEVIIGVDWASIVVGTLAFAVFTGLWFALPYASSKRAQHRERP